MYFATACAIFCSRSLARSVPTNYILLSIFTFCISYLVAFVTTAYDPATVIMAAVMTAGIVVSLTIYAMTTKTDFTVLGGFLWIFGMTFCLFGMLFAIYGQLANTVYCAIGVILFGFYLIYDT